MNRSFWSAAGALALLTACSANGAVPNVPAPLQPAASGAKASATFVVSVVQNAPDAPISPSAQSVAIALSGKTLLTMNVAASSPACAAAKNGMRVCSQRAAVPAGKQIFDVVAYDGRKGSGNVLASGTATATVVQGRDVRVPLALTGRPARLTLWMRNAYPPAGQPAKTAVHVEARDVDGNTILGAYASPVTLTDSDASGTTKLSATTVARSSDRVELSYDGGALLSATISAQARGLHDARLPFAPSPRTVAQYTAPMLTTKYGPLPLGIADLCIGPDGNVWATGASGGAIVKVGAGGTFTMYPIVGTGPIGISLGSDRNLWFAESQVGKIGKATAAGVITSYTIPVPKGVTSQPNATALGPDGRTWFVDQGYNAVGFGAVASDGKIVKYPLPGGSSPTEITAGPDGNLWITDGGLNAIVVASTSGKVLAVHTLPTANAGPWGIVTGPDKNVWFAEFAANKIGRITTKGAISEWAVPSASAGPLNVAAGPDGNVWFTETGGGFWNYSGKVGYITPTGSQIREFPSLPVAAHVHDLVFDPKGVLWYSQFASSYSALSEFAY